jgi:hypothetical protein
MFDPDFGRVLDLQRGAAEDFAEGAGGHGARGTDLTLAADFGA